MFPLPKHPLKLGPCCGVAREIDCHLFIYATSGAAHRKSE